MPVNNILIYQILNVPLKEPLPLLQGPTKKIVVIAGVWL
jgi:hypothetical protein